MVTISLEDDEALLLFELLASLPNDQTTLDLSDRTNLQVVWNLEGLLEEQLVEPLREDYQQLVARARERMRKSFEE